MANYCPNCNRKLKITDWHQNCPGCGTNLMFIGFEKKFFEDAKQAELGRARVRVWWSKVLAAFIGGKLQIARLVIMLFPVLALLLPFCSLKAEFPLYSGEISAGILGAVNLFSGKDLSALIYMKDAPVTGEVIKFLVFVLGIFAAALVCAAMVIVSRIVAVINDRTAGVMAAVFAALGFAASGAGIYASFLLSKAVSSYSGIFTYSGGFGAYAAMVAFAAVFAIELVVLVKKYEVPFKEGDLYRIEVYRKLRKGKITLDELPYPITETEEERAERLRAIEDTVNGKSPNEDGEVSGQ